MKISDKICESRLCNRLKKVINVDDLRYDLQTGFLLRYDANAFKVFDAQHVIQSDYHKSGSQIKCKVLYKKEPEFHAMFMYPVTEHSYVQLKG